LDIIWPKVLKVIRSSYSKAGSVKHLPHHFATPEAVDTQRNVLDVQMVYDGTKRGLDEALRALNFYFLNFDASSLFLDFNPWIFVLVHMDCFLNFPQAPILQSDSGITLKPFDVRVQRDLPL